MRSNEMFTFFCAVLIILFVILSAIWGVIRIRVEQDTFNRCTGSSVSFIEAAATQLRVENCIK